MSKIPKLHFKEFSGEWKVEKFGELTKFQQGVQVDVELQSKEPKNGYIKFLRIENYTQNSQDLRYIPNDLAKNKTISENEIAVVRYGATAGFIGRGFNGVLANNLFKLVPNSSILDTEYLFQYLKSHKVFSFFQSEMSGGAMPALSFGIVQVLRIPYPSIQEQKKIASFLSAFDTKIDQLTRKKELLVQYKKGAVQKIFSQELRFKADDGNEFSEWEEKMLGNVCTIKKGTQLNKDDLDDSGEYAVINGGITPSGYNDEWNTEGDTITISEGGNSCGFVNFMNDKFWSGGHCYTLDNVKSFVINDFLYQYLKAFQIQLMRLRVGSGLPNIQKGDMTKFKISIPSKVEQIKIANFLSVIDTKIDLATIQIDEVKNFKKGLLQQMFV